MTEGLQTWATWHDIHWRPADWCNWACEVGMAGQLDDPFARQRTLSPVVSGAKHPPVAS